MFDFTSTEQHKPRKILIVRLLLEREGPLHAEDSKWGTALGAAAFCGYVAVVHFLIERGADVKTRAGEYGTQNSATNSNFSSTRRHKSNTVVA